jgi:hypothetical protein
MTACGYFTIESQTGKKTACKKFKTAQFQEGMA